MPTSYWVRIDSATANNPAMNLTGAAAFEVTFVAETPTGDPGDYFLDQPGTGIEDPDTLISIGGTTYSFIFELAGTLPTENRDGAGKLPPGAGFEGDPVYILTVIDYPSPGDTTRISLLPESDATEAEMNGFGNGAIDIQGVNNNPPPSAICFDAETRIATPGGPRLARNIKIGDYVLTHDHGPQPVLWVHATHLQWPGDSEAMRPIAIPRGALGPNMPDGPLIVSPQHRIFVEHAADDGPKREWLVPAIGLLGWRGIRRMMGRSMAHYVHILLPRHAIIRSNNALTESFFPGAEALKALAPTARRSLAYTLQCWGDRTVDDYGPLARKTLTRRQTELLLARISQSGTQDVQSAPATSTRRLAS